MEKTQNTETKKLSKKSKYNLLKFLLPIISLLSVINFVPKGYKSEKSFNSKFPKKYNFHSVKCDPDELNIFEESWTINQNKTPRRLKFYPVNLSFDNQEDAKKFFCLTPAEFAKKDVYILFHGWNNTIYKSYLLSIGKSLQLQDINKNLVILVDTDNIVNDSLLADKFEFLSFLRFPPYRESKYSSLIAGSVYKRLQKHGLSKTQNVYIFGHSLGALMAGVLAKKIKSVQELWLMNPPGEIFGKYKIDFKGGELGSVRNLAKKVIVYSTQKTFYDDQKNLPKDADFRYSVVAEGFSKVEKHWVFQETLKKIFNGGIEMLDFDNNKTIINKDWMTSFELKKETLDVKGSPVPQNAIFILNEDKKLDYIIYKNKSVKILKRPETDLNIDEISKYIKY